MENEKKELERPEIQDPHKKRYVVYTKRDTELMKTFIRFDNRVRPVSYTHLLEERIGKEGM